MESIKILPPARRRLCLPTGSESSLDETRFDAVTVLKMALRQRRKRKSSSRNDQTAPDSDTLERNPSRVKPVMAITEITIKSVASLSPASRAVTGQCRDGDASGKPIFSGYCHCRISKSAYSLIGMLWHP